MNGRLHPLWTAVVGLSLAGCQPKPSAPEQVVRIPVPEPAPCTSQQLSSEALFRRARDGVVVVEAEGSQGSGFVVRHQDGDTLLLTNSHVVGESRSVKLTWADGQEENAAVVADAGAATPQTDLAIKREPPNVGADVVALGAPKGLEFSLTRGVVSSLRDNGEILQLDAPINPGNSGGPVLDQTGCVVGIATFKISESEGLNFAVAAGVMANFLAKPPPVAQELPPAIPLEPEQSAAAPEPEGQRANCWFQLREGSSDFTGLRCQVSGRTNANGHQVHDILEPNGGVFIYTRP